MASLVADTHTVIWYLLQSPKLSSNASAALDAVSLSVGSIYIASISLIEIIYLVEKARIPKIALERLLTTLSDLNSCLALAPLDIDVVQAVSKLSRDAVPDMPDRIIAATALHFDLPLVTCDSKLRATMLKTIW